MRYDAPELQLRIAHQRLVEELLDKADAKGLGPPAAAALARCHAHLRARCASAWTAWPRCWWRTCGLVPGNRVLLRGGNSDGHGAGLAGRRQGGHGGGGHHAACCAPRSWADIIDKAQPSLSFCEAKLAARAGGSAQKAHRSRRHRAHGVHLRHHRQAQGRRAQPPRRDGRLRDLATPCAQGHA
jgi:hypothetical protein